MNTKSGIAHVGLGAYGLGVGVNVRSTEPLPECFEKVRAQRGYGLRADGFEG